MKHLYSKSTPKKDYGTSGYPNLISPMVLLLFLIFFMPADLAASDESNHSSEIEKKEDRDTIPDRIILFTESYKFQPALLPMYKKQDVKRKGIDLTVFGYFRFLTYARNITEPYPNLAPYEKAYGIGDGYREPLLSLTLVGKPNSRSQFGTELFIFSPYLGTGVEDNVLSLNLGINMYGNFRTDHGKFAVQLGGIYWYSQTPFTVGTYQALDRYSIFERTPWEGVSNTEKYDSYFQTGAIDRGDERWDNQALHGFVLSASELPGKLFFRAFWGKFQPNGGLANAQNDPLASIFSLGTAGNTPTYQGFNGTNRFLPSYSMGGFLGKDIGKHFVAYSSIVSRTSLDSLSKNFWQYQVHTANFLFDFDKILLSGELGAGGFESPDISTQWGEALMVRLQIDKELTFLPIDIQIYQISKNFFNQNGEISTNGNPEYRGAIGNNVVAGETSAGGAITQVNELVHNRRGININTGYSVGAFKFNLGWGLAAEIEALSTEISYVHRINGLALSRIYNPFPENAVSATNFGPYGRKYSYFRGVFESVFTTDLDPSTGEALTLKYYNSVDLQAKVHFDIFKKPMYLFYLGSFGSASSKAGAIPNYGDNSYLFVQYHEFDLYYEIFRKFILTGYFGIENIRGGRLTEWDAESLLPRDQLGIGIGAGFDYTIADNAGLYFRHRWMNFKDRSFADDHMKGREMTVELKIFF